MGEHCCPHPLLELVGIRVAVGACCCDEATALVADADAMMFCENFAAADRAVGLRRNLILALVSVLVFYQSMAIMQ